MKRAEGHFAPPGLIARATNRRYGWFVSLGLGPSCSFVLLAKGRKSGIDHATPVNLLRLNDKLYLVGTRGYTQWSRNVRVSGALTLKRGRVRLRFSARVVADDDKAEILKAYLLRFKWMAWRFFPVPAEAEVESFAAIAPRYPVFELLAQK